MVISMFQVDAFTEEVFKGKSSAICILEEWIDDKLMQNIASENNLPDCSSIIFKGWSIEMRICKR